MHKIRFGAILKSMTQKAGYKYRRPEESLNFEGLVQPILHRTLPSYRNNIAAGKHFS